jgi:tRNA nucleotidyltransferase (CCA-adding enzyme)
MLSRLDELGILHAIHPALPWDEDIQAQLHQLDQIEVEPLWELPERFDSLSCRQILAFLIWLGKLPETTLRLIASRLRCKSELLKLLEATSQIIHHLPNLVDAPPSRVVRELEKFPRTALFAAHLITSDEKKRTLLHKFVSRWAAVTPSISGEDLRTMGLKPSPAYGRILATLRDAWLDGTVQSIEEEHALLNELLAGEEFNDPQS